MVREGAIKPYDLSPSAIGLDVVAGPVTIRPYPHGPEFVVTDDFDRFFADYEPDPERRRDYINAIIWELGRNPRGLTYGPEDRKTRAYDSNHLPAWPVLRIWLWFETEDRIHFCDVDVA